MTNAKSRLLLLAVGLLTAGPASAATLTVYAKMSGSNAVGKVAPVSGTTTINCFTNSPANCVDAAATGAIVLEATSESNATFVSWAGCASVTGAQCTLDLTSSKTVTANFRAATQALTVKTYPAAPSAFGGKLTAATTPAIDCGRQVETDPETPETETPVTACSASAGTSVELTAVPLAGSKVQSWSGCSTSTATTCTVSMTSPKVVSATFGPANIPVTAQINGPGKITAGLVTNKVTNAIDCGTDCSGQVVPGQSITLVAVPTAGAIFIGWTGCSSADRVCTITDVQAPKTVSATFRSTSCGSCHGTPPTAAHTAFTGACATCHTGYTNSSVDSTVHMDGTVQAPTNHTVAPPAGFGFNLEVVGFQPLGDTTYPRGYVDLKATDSAANVLDIRALMNGCEMNSGSLTVLPCDGSSRAPRVSIGQIQADGSFKPVLANKDAAAASSETIATTRLTDMGSGVYRYQPQYGFLASVAHDAAKDYRAVAYGGRYYKAANQTAVPFYSSDYADLQGTGTARAKETVTDAACNACHGQLTLHGMRRGVAVCLSCHNPNLPLGSGNTDAFKWDLKNLAHKIHSGMNYDGLNPMTGVMGTEWGSTMDASHMAQGPSHTTYFEGGGSATTATVDDNIHQLPTQTQCKLCHDETKTDHLVASQAGCSSCHEINWVTGAGHGASYPTILADETGYPHTDAECAGCHPATGPVVHQYTPVVDLKYPVATVHSALWEPTTGHDFNRYFDADGVTPVNTVDFNGTRYPGVPVSGRHELEVTITNVTIPATGIPTIDFTVTLDGAPYQTLVSGGLPAAINSATTSSDVLGGRFPTCAFIFAGPTGTDYTFPANGSAQMGCTSGQAPSQVIRATAVDASAGKYRLVATGASAAVLAGKTGTYTVSYEMMWQRQAGNATDGVVRKPFAAKPKFYVVSRSDVASAWTFLGEEGAGARRKVVAFGKCNNCHIQIGFHSNQGRQGPDYCATCHNPMLDNSARDRVKFADARNPAEYGAYVDGPVPAGQKTYLVESVSMNVFIHRIHMGSDLPSVASNGDLASPWVPEPGRIFYGATRAATVGSPDGAPPSITDLSEFAMPNPMGRCDQCHVSGSWGMPETARAPVVRRFKLCAPITYLGEQWCDPASTNGPATVGTLYTPPIKAVCTSCHDDLATDAHVDSNTVYPMSADAVESCGGCHGESAPWDVVRVHPVIP